MKTFVQITLLFLFNFSLYSQELGSLRGYVKNAENDSPIAGVKITFMSDTLEIDSVFTNELGYYYKPSIAPLEYSLRINKEKYHSKIIHPITIQAKQVGRFDFYIQKGDSSITSNYTSLSGVESLNGTGIKSLERSLIRYSDFSNLHLSECVIVSYSTPLIDHSQGNSNYTITHEDISRMPTRSATSMASTVGGVLADERGNITSIRGSRANNVSYYVDGIKVRSLNGIPKSMLKDVQVYTGGLPANYGNTTGGVVSVNTRGYRDYPRERQTHSNYTNNYIQDEPEEIPRIFSDKFETESYEMIYENEFLTPQSNPLSTFSIDVDNASYSNTRRFLNQGRTPNTGAVRIEEMINYFNYDYEAPDSANNPLLVHTEFSNCPWNNNHRLLKVGMKGFEVEMENQKANNLVFLVDVSGSMTDQNKLPLLISSIKLMVENFKEEDKIAIVVYAGAAGVVLKTTSGADKNKISNALDQLNAGGSTNGVEGINLAYKLAEESFIPDGNNRIILATDGDFNVGVTSPDALEELISEKRKSNIFLTTLGLGMGNYKDDKLEVLADKGNGNYFYIDNLMEAKKALVTEFFGTVYTISKDVKLQLEFNPKHVKSYRLIGYENRLLAAQDFNNDAKDAGELGSGHTVTALYEIIPADSEETVDAENIDDLRYQKVKKTGKTRTDELLQIKCRYKLPLADSSNLKVFRVENVLSDPSTDFNFAVSVAAYGMKLRNSQFIEGFSFNQIYELAVKNMGEDQYGYRKEFLELIKKADQILAKQSD